MIDSKKVTEAIRERAGSYHSVIQDRETVREKENYIASFSTRRTPLREIQNKNVRAI